MIPSEQQVEQRAAVLGLTAPRVTPAMIDALVESLTFDTHYISGTTTVVATSVLPSGITIASTMSASASAENFNLALGIEVAIGKCKEDSRKKLWELEGYRLKQALHEQSVDIAADSVRTIRANLEQARGESALHRAASLRAECTGVVQPCPCGAGQAQPAPL